MPVADNRIKYGTEIAGDTIKFLGNVFGGLKPLFRYAGVIAQESYPAGELEQFCNIPGGGFPQIDDIQILMKTSCQGVGCRESPL